MPVTKTRSEWSSGKLIFTDEPVGSDHGLIGFKIGSSAADAASGLLIGGGTSALPCVTSTADGKFIEFRCKTEATSGDNRLLYLRYEVGSTGGGECLRAFSSVSAAAGTVHGAHLSLTWSGSGTISGLGVAGRNTLHIPSNASWTPGTIAAVQAEIYSDGADSDPDGATELSYFRVVNDGNASGIADVDDDALLMSIQGGTIGTGNLVEAATDETSYSHNIRIKVGSTELYLMCADDRD